ncbi:MAG: 4-hydroxy-tetrahydrodipicolinate reductase [Rickettsiaceae bacterium]|jgi:4-hydroxy-tetrahydrodipicolinate reductase|nr:4-hydroxy-tetrahydrodipicolinate reductase [Rickettsiaceae bacterium]
MKIGIIGITGRMGQSVAKAVLENDLTDISGGLVRLGSELSGQDIGKIIGGDNLGINATDNLEEMVKNSDVIIDFSNPDLALQIAGFSSKYNKILVSGTTGFSEAQKQQFKNYAQNCVIVWSSNMSIGVNLLMNLAEQVAKLLHSDYDVEIFEMHHRNKIDAPSGTALALGEAVAKGRNLNFGEVYRKSRDGIVGKRSDNEIGFCSLRGGDVIGDHSVIFAGSGERVELTHKASNRDIYAIGSIRAAIWSQGKPHGFYTMRDVLS